MWHNQLRTISANGMPIAFQYTVKLWVPLGSRLEEWRLRRTTARAPPTSGAAYTCINKPSDACDAAGVLHV